MAISRRHFLGGAILATVGARVGGVPAASAQTGAGTAPKHGGVLIATPVTAAASFSLHEEASVATVQVTMPCYNNLVVVDQSKPRSSDDTLVGELAERWEWRDGGRALALSLRQGVKWHDGKAFSSADVRHTFDMLREVPGATAKLRVNPRKDWYANVQAVETPDAHTVVFRLKRPQPSLLMILGSGFSAVYPAHVAPADLRLKPLGTGPFRFVKHQPGQVVELERNPDYFVKGRPYLDGLRFLVIDKRETQMAALATGQLDIGPVIGITRPMAEAAVRNNPKLTVIDTATNSDYNITMHCKKPPFDNPKVRLAVSLAVDRQGFQRGVMQGDAILSATMLPAPEGAWGLPASELKSLPGFGDSAESKARARALLAEAGFSATNPLRVSIVTRVFGMQPDAASYVASELSKVGVSATVEPLETALWYNRLNRRDFLIALNAIGRVDDPDPTFYENYLCGSPRNYGEYCNPEVDKLVDLQSSTTDRARRRQIVLEIQRRLEADAARPILGFSKTSVVFAPHVKGFVPHTNIHNYHRMQDVWLDR